MRVAVVYSEKAVKNLSGFMTPAGECGDYSLFVHAGDNTLKDAICRAIRSLPRWSPYPWGDATDFTSTVDSDGITLANKGVPGNKGVCCTSPLRGDKFAVSVDYTISDFPTPTNKDTRNEIFLAVFIGDLVYRVSYLTSKSDHWFFYQAWPVHTAVMPAEYALSGKIRLTKNGSRLVGEVCRGGAWATIGSMEIPAGLPAYPALGTYCDTGQRLVVHFGNPQIIPAP